ncbi:MAG TPA: hypothetical protein VGL42_02890 [Opitutaceae bacterium]|jgi:hypothetical protein
MSAAAPASRSSTFSGPLGVVLGVIIGVGAWLIPDHFRSISPGLLSAAGHGTSSVIEFGNQLVDRERIGPAKEVLDTAREISAPGAEDLARRLGDLQKRQPEFAAWGGWDPFLDPLFNLRAPSGHTESTPVMTFFITQQGRDALRNYLGTSGSIGVQAILRTRTLGYRAAHLPAASQPGGQPTDALILLTALLYQSDHLGPSLQRDLHALADSALAQGDLGDLGSFYLDLLALSRRLDWAQLTELMGRSDSTRTVNEYAQLARAASREFSVIYTAALFTNSADRVADYLLENGKTGAANLRLALSDGRGAVKLLIDRQVPVIHEASEWSPGAGLVLAHPRAMLTLKWLAWFVAGFCLLLGLDRWMVSPEGIAESERSAPQLRAGILALFLTGLILIATEPFLLKASAPSIDYRPHLTMLVVQGTPPPSSNQIHHASMNSSTYVTIGIFALLQVMMYFICLQKINQIARQNLAPLLKLRLMENEENLFDSGLYVGMMGTAAALVLQVLGVISPNLLAAYSSNLFGLLCVALVKIRHVRLFKRRLILEHETGLRTSPA